MIKQLSTYNMIIIALFSALIAIGAFIKIPIGPVPFSMQFLFCALAGVLLRKEMAFLSVLIYISIGLIGIPVFTKGGGLAYVFQPTFGYLIGFMFAAYVIGAVLQKLGTQKIQNYFIACLCGLCVVYICGVSYLFIILNLYMGKNVSVVSTIKIGFLPFLLPDLGWSLVVAFLASHIKPRLQKTGLL